MENGFSLDAALERTRAATAAKAAGENLPKSDWSGVKRQKPVSFDFDAAFQRAKEKSQLAKSSADEVTKMPSI